MGQPRRTDPSRPNKGQSAYPLSRRGGGRPQRQAALCARRKRREETGDAILSRKPKSLVRFFAALKKVDVPADFLIQAERQQGDQHRDPLEGWAEWPV